MGWQDREYAHGGSGGTGGFGMFSSRAGSRFSDNPLNWSPTIGRLFGIRVRVHITLILFVAFELLAARYGVLHALKLSLVLFGSVLLHEFGHCFAARSVGGGADDILMWPLGGLASVDAPRQPWPQFVTVICGPLVNVALLIVSGVILKLRGAVFIFGSISPYDWVAFSTDASELGRWLSLIFMINGVLLVFNLWPMYPMDGGRMLHCALWKWMGHQRGTMLATTVGMVAAVIMGLSGLMSQTYTLLIIAILGYITCYQERMMVKAGALEEDGFMGYNFSGGYTTLDPQGQRKKPGWLAKMKARSAAKNRERERREELVLQEKVDRILEKIKNEGIGSLTRGEKKLLEDATKRQKSRL